MGIMYFKRAALSNNQKRAPPAGGAKDVLPSFATPPKAHDGYGSAV